MVYLGTPVSSTNKTDCHDITEILFKVALDTITRTLYKKKKKGQLLELTTINCIMNTFHFKWLTLFDESVFINYLLKPLSHVYTFRPSVRMYTIPIITTLTTRQHA